MTFDAKAFRNEQFQHRTEAVLVPGLSQWFDDDSEWIVRGLTAHEFARCQDAGSRDKTLSTVLESIDQGTKSEQVQALRESFGLGDKTPEEISRRIQMLITASVDPECDRELAVKLAERFPIEFYQITNKITELTGRGQEPGKPKDSGIKPT